MSKENSYVVEMNQDFIENMGEYENLILNLMAGLSIEDLQEDEIQLLREKHGDQWKSELGYE